MSETFHNILVLLGVILVGALGWYMFDQNRQLQLQTSTTSGVSIQAETQAFIQKQNTLRQLSIESDLFQNGDFRNLTDVSTPVPTFPTGRSNLFAIPF